ncbi:DUF3105 domain-containing protein [Pseudolysinimonas sp.]|uniref:DUF3105 domain-containing protein n=1 Tax=Pseudolysinimonas sp. TaxID=2680009 RepID=UPI00286AEC61|nr:DUF3105 domain-containing protein [Pseudolysinimonas sp.]
MATPPNRPAQPTIKEQRADKRAAQLAAFKKQEAARKRNRILGIVAAVAALVLVAGTVTTVLVLNATPQQVDEELVSGDYADRLQLYPDLEATHTENRVSYDQSPPVGGAHNPAWLNCGVYDEEQQSENVVHTLEHGAVWIAYDPASTTDAEIAALVELAPDTYTVISPYDGLGEAMAISAWGAQMRFTDVDDAAVTDFLTDFWRSPDSPEPNAPCTGALDGPGKVS